MRIRRSKRSSKRQTLGIGSLAATALAFGVVAVALSPAAQGAPGHGAPDPSDLIAQLECDERSVTDSGEVAYEITNPPSYPQDYRPAEAPELVAAQAAGEFRGLARAPQRVETYRAGDRVDFALEDAEGRVVGFVTAVNEGGWRHGGSIACAALR